ncbi:hypothetical protein Droror1_Dr00006407 [Drosera rotundifolia]
MYFRNGRFQGSARGKGSRVAMASVKPSGVRTMNFTSLQQRKAVNFLGCPKRDFYSGMRPAVGIGRPKAYHAVSTAMYYERFSESSLSMINHAIDETRHLGSNFVGTEHILLGLVSEGTGIAAKLLQATGIDLKDACDEVERINGRESGHIALEISFTTKAKHVFELSLEAARQLRDDHIGPEHLLLGLSRSGGGFAGVVLKNLGADLDEIHKQVLNKIHEQDETITLQNLGLED